MTRQFNKLSTNDELLNRIQENIRMALDPLSTDILFNRQEISATIGTNTVIQHNLKRVPKGFIVVDRGNAGVVYRTAWDNQSITLTSSVSGDFKFLLF